MPRGKRYSSRKKNIILKEITEHNKEHGRGGVFQAHKKHGVAIKTLNNWLAQSSGTARDSKPAKPAKKKVVRRKRAGKKSVKKKAGRRPGRPPGKASFSGRFKSSLQKIEKCERQIAKLEALVAKEKAQLQGLFR